MSSGGDNVCYLSLPTFFLQHRSGVLLQRGRRLCVRYLVCGLPYASVARLETTQQVQACMPRRRHGERRASESHFHCSSSTHACLNLRQVRRGGTLSKWQVAGEEVKVQVMQVVLRHVLNIGIDTHTPCSRTKNSGGEKRTKAPPPPTQAGGNLRFQYRFTANQSPSSLSVPCW